LSKGCNDLRRSSFHPRRRIQPDPKEDIMALPQKLLINGELIDGPLRLDVIDPAAGAPFTTVPRASATQAEAAIAAAKAAQPGWAALPAEKRRDCLNKLADAVEANASELARTLVQEQGKPLPEAEAEVSFTAIFLRHFANLELPVEVVQDDDTLRVEVHHKALGVVVGIAPWNFPLLIGANKLAPALILGNTFVLKPPPTAPVTSLMLGALAKDIFPHGVVNVLADQNDLGPLLTSHPDVAKISFTGSTATGRKIAQSGASQLKRLTLELGGNDAGIVMGDVDVAAVAPKIFGSAFMNCGQVCIAMKRVYAHSSIYDQLCEALAKLADEAIVGDGLEQGTQIGPLQNKTQYEKAKRYLEIAKRDGKIIAGGDILDKAGYFLRPTIVRDIEDGSELVDQEQFAPILPIIKYDDLDDAVRRANASEYGLGGSVWSADSEKAYAVAKKIESGTVWVNHHLHFGPHIPFGGAKQSGIGVEFSVEGLKEFSQTSVISIART
jgi:acyl-CoA reductase-like NAD-dependent aldehyde dehydrogenase